MAVTFDLKQLEFTWNAATGATDYHLMERVEGISAFIQVGSDLPGSATSVALDIAVHRHNWPATRYVLDACNSAGCARSNEVNPMSGMLQTIGYVKASNTEADDAFGLAVALSGDGNTFAVSAAGEDSAAIGINGDQLNNSASESGAVYVFVRSVSGNWSQQAYLKASNTGEFDGFGESLSLSSDGNTLAVGASEETSAATGIDGDQTNDSALGAGAAYIFTRSPGGVWSQQAYIKASNTNSGDIFGHALALSGDGNTLAVGALMEDSSAIGINGSQNNESAPGSGAVYVFTRTPGGVWSQQAYVKASNTGVDDHFGEFLAISGDGNTLAVGAAEDSAATGINGNQFDESALNAGAVYVFTRSGATWSQQAYIKSSNTETGDRFGFNVCLNADGNMLAVGAFNEDSAATGVAGNQTDNSAPDSGAAYVFTRSAGMWSQHVYLKASNTETLDHFGDGIALSGDGNTLAVSTFFEDSAATGINGDQSDNSAFNAGAAYVFTRNGGGVWSQLAYVKAPMTKTGEFFADSVAVDQDGDTLALGSTGESSSATGISGSQTDTSASGAGAAYLY